ncbi:SCO2521 family protein [Actinoplanes solisilvae]|uniref:SCO2521 family protein n=1 Tax=Actinoplanes solisilvae TaxID=2486853 RepID=UPI000FDA7038|nr:SCO2521 family protein [Actinoplanes solisilvae]
MLILGEVRTSLLPNSAALPPHDGERLLGLTAGARVLRSERPISSVTSPPRLTGVDCQVPTAPRRTTRAIGTVATRAMLTGGHVLQASAHVIAEPSPHSRRLPWSYYLARHGRVEIVGGYDEAGLAGSFLLVPPVAPLLNLHAIGGQVIERVRRSPDIDKRPPIRSAPTRLRWTARTTGADELSFTVDDEGRRSLLLVADGARPAEVVALCEDIALHDWLLTTLTAILEHGGPDLTGTAAGADRIRAAVDHLLHLWMPGARLNATMRGFWTSLEERAGFGRQWGAAVQRIRDHLAVSTLRQLGRLAPAGPS